MWSQGVSRVRVILRPLRFIDKLVLPVSSRGIPSAPVSGSRYSPLIKTLVILDWGPPQ